MWSAEGVVIGWRVVGGWVGWPGNWAGVALAARQ